MLIYPSCSKDSQVPSGGNPATPVVNPQPTDWLIPKESVFDGGPGKDGIPSIDDPKFSNMAEVNFLSPEDLILGVKVGDDIRGYPHPILDWHEIVNDEINGQHLAITYCPLTGTGIAWNREIEGKITTFGVSGLLFNSNLLPYDRESDSYWSQMLLKSVNGSRQGKVIESYPLIETTWQTWKLMFPDAKVLNTNTGFNRSYGRYPYGNYKTDHQQLLFPVENEVSRLPRKQRGLGLSSGTQAKFYSLETFKDELRVINDSFAGVEVVVFGSRSKNFIVAYQRKTNDGQLLTFSQDSTVDNEVQIKDDQGNRWDIFGEAISGPMTGSFLTPTTSYMGYFFAWAAFYPEIEVF